jgi:site-specific recombinase XerD
LTTKQIQDWLLDLELAPATVRNYRTRLSSLCNYAVKKHYMDSNPVEDVEIEAVIDKPPGILAPDELTRLLNVAGPICYR